MKFDSSRAWQDATASVGANRDVLFPVAGVFFLLPSIVTTYFFSDLQNRILTNMANQDEMARIMEGNLGSLISMGLISFVLSAVGYLALLALLTDRTRPTVGEAIMDAIKALPTVIGTVILLMIGYIVVALMLGLVIGGLGAATGSGGLAFVLVLVAIAVVFWLLTKLSLILPVIMIEKVLNPVTAITRSWQLTSGNSLRIFGFYFLLFIAYLVISIVVGFTMMGLLISGVEPGTFSLLAAGVISGIVGAIAGVLFTAILAAIHNQLAGPSAEAVSSTFD